MVVGWPPVIMGPLPLPTPATARARVTWRIHPQSTVVVEMLSFIPETLPMNAFTWSSWQFVLLASSSGLHEPSLEYHANQNLNFTSFKLFLRKATSENNDFVLWNCGFNHSFLFCLIPAIYSLVLITQCKSQLTISQIYKAKYNHQQTTHLLQVKSYNNRAGGRGTKLSPTTFDPFQFYHCFGN